MVGGNTFSMPPTHGPHERRRTDSRPQERHQPGGHIYCSLRLIHCYFDCEMHAIPDGRSIAQRLAKMNGEAEKKRLWEAVFKGPGDAR